MRDGDFPIDKYHGFPPLFSALPLLDPKADTESAEWDQAGDQTLAFWLEKKEGVAQELESTKIKSLAFSCFSSFLLPYLRRHRDSVTIQNRLLHRLLRFLRPQGSQSQRSNLMIQKNQKPETDRHGSESQCGFILVVGPCTSYLASFQSSLSEMGIIITFGDLQELNHCCLINGLPQCLTCFLFNKCSFPSIIFNF
jgi:hypothetical protein